MLSHMAPRIAADAVSRAGHEVVWAAEESAIYACAGEDEWCAVTLRGPADEHAVAHVTGRLDLADWCRGQTALNVMERLQAAGVAAGAMLRVSELPGFHYYVERGFFRPAVHPHVDEPFIVEAAPVRARHLPDPPDRPAPLLGEHTAEVLRDWLSMPDDQISDLLARNVLEQPGTAPVAPAAVAPNEQKFFGSFFQKRTAF
jgi:crotonobetainyl-CoA:carnitine CoA-transferase CaiB-like acyl-CoA transferase